MTEIDFAYLVDSLQIDKEKVLQFFFVFSRFEYALKRSSYVTGAVGNDVSANWDKFANDVDTEFWANMTPEVKAAVTYLEKNPPMIQIVKDSNHALGWKEKSYEKEKLCGLLLMVRKVRNNLFHGGKFPYMSKEDESRNTMLLDHCLTILKACLPLNEEVNGHFQDKLE